MLHKNYTLTINPNVVKLHTFLKTNSLGNIEFPKLDDKQKNKIMMKSFASCTAIHKQQVNAELVRFNQTQGSKSVISPKQYDLYGQDILN